MIENRDDECGKIFIGKYPKIISPQLVEQYWNIICVHIDNPMQILYRGLKAGRFWFGLPDKGKCERNGGGIVWIGRPRLFGFISASGNINGQ